MRTLASAGRSGKRAAALGFLAALALPAVAGERELVVLAEERVLDSWPVLERIARQFEADHPGVRVRLLDEGGAAGSRDRIKFLLAGDLQVDVARIDVTEIAAFAGEGALVDLAPLLAADPSFDSAQFWAGPLAALRDDAGHLWGLPSTFTPYVMYVNLDLLARARLDRPRAGWTWDDLVVACRAATRDTDGDGRADEYGISLTQWLQAVAPWIWQNEADFLDASGQRARMGEPRFVEAIAFLRRLLHEEKVASFDASFANQLAQGLFQAGRAAFYGPVGYWETYRFRHLDGFRWDVVPLPRGRVEATSVAMTCYVVPRTSGDPALAAEFVRAMAGPEYQRVLAEMGNGVPGLVDVARSASFLKPEVAPESEHVFLDVLPSARFLPPAANWRKIESIVQAELEQCLLVADHDPAAACARMAAATDAYLARERERHDRPALPRAALAGAGVLGCFGIVGLWLARRRRERTSAGGRVAGRVERDAHVLLTPWALGFLLFLVGPAAASLLLAFAEWSPLRSAGDVRWMGLENFARLGADPTFGASFGATLLFAALSVPLTLVLALGLALLVSGESRLAAVARTAIYVPAILSPVVVGALGRWIFDPDDGPVNMALRALGLADQSWLRDPERVLVPLVIVTLWSAGAQMLVFVAALSARDRTLEDAARLDGAGPIARFWHVVLPGLTPVVLFNLVLGLLAALQAFALPFVMTGGGPGDASRFLVLYLYESAFRHFDAGYASAIAWALVAVSAAAVGLVFWSSRRWVHYAARSAR